MGKTVSEKKDKKAVDSDDSDPDRPMPKWKQQKHLEEIQKMKVHLMLPIWLLTRFTAHGPF